MNLLAPMYTFCYPALLSLWYFYMTVISRNMVLYYRLFVTGTKSVGMSGLNYERLSFKHEH